MIAEPPPLVDVDDSEETPVCFKCFRPFRPGVTFCEHCGNPISANALSLPFEGVLEQIRLVADAADLESPSTAIVVGLWTLAVPWAVFLAVAAFHPGFPLLPMLWTAFLGVVAVRATRHWRMRRAPAR